MAEVTSFKIVPPKSRSTETSVKTSPVEFRRGAAVRIRFAQTGAWLCGVTGLFVSGFVSVVRAVGTNVVPPLWVEEVGFEVIATRPLRALGIAVPVRADDEFVPAVYGVLHRSGLRLYLGRPN